MLPNFLGIGAPKAATTWLFRCLSEHPEVFITSVKETEYFSWRHTMQDLQDYEQHFSEAEDIQVKAVGEISTSYLHWEGTPQRVKDVIPDVRLFVSLRNPVDQIYSHYWHLLRQNFHQQERPRPSSFEEALETYPDQLLRPARYAEHLTSWLRYFDRGQIHVLFHDDIKSDPEQTLRGLYTFLGVSEDFSPGFLEARDARVRIGTSPKSQTAERVYTILYDTLSQKVYFPLRNLLGRRVAETLKNSLGVREILEQTFRQKGYPEMDDQTRNRLLKQTEEDIHILESLTGRDLSHWVS